jgi:hypothetical protein
MNDDDDYRAWLTLRICILINQKSFLNDASVNKQSE